MEKEYTWNPQTSKWKAGIELGLPIELEGSENILYLGASSGTTVGHLSDRTSGKIFAVEKSVDMTIPLIRLAEKKGNILPIFADAHNTEYLKEKIQDTKINILFQDIPSLDQVDIITKASKLVEKDCKILLSLKTLSISKQDPKTTFQEMSKKLEENFKIIESKKLEKFHKGHTFFVLEKL